MSSLDSSYFQKILNIKSSVKLTSLVRNTCPTISSLYYKIIKRIRKTTFLNVDINRKEPVIKSF